MVFVALPAFSQNFDVESSTFWAIGYAIPDAYAVTRVVVDAPQLTKAGERIVPCQWEDSPAAPLVAYARCRVAPAAADRSLGKLRRLHPLRDIPARRAVPGYPELYFKRDALGRESSEIEGSAESVPGIWGVLEAQTSTLKRLIDAHELAQRPLIEVVVVSSSATATLEASLKAADGMRERVRVRERPPEVHWTHHWTRASYSVCEQLPVVFVSCATRGPSAEKSIRAALRRLGEPFEEPGCSFKDSLMVLTDIPPSRLMPKLIVLEGMISLRVSPRMRYHADLSDDERFDALSAELSTQAALLDKVPTIRAFVRGELERIRKTADGLRLAKGRSLIVVKIVPDK